MSTDVPCSPEEKNETAPKYSNSKILRKQLHFSRKDVGSRNIGNFSHLTPKNMTREVDYPPEELENLSRDTIYCCAIVFMKMNVHIHI